MSDGEEPVFGLIRPLALLGLVASISGRSLYPALRGADVGLGRLVSAAELVGSLASQVFAAAVTMAAVFAVMAVSRSRLPLWLRLGALALGGFAVLPTVWAVHQPVPESSASLAACSAGLLALAAIGPALSRAPYARLPAVIVGLIALGGLLRVADIGAVLALQGSKSGPPIAPTTVGSVAFVLDAAAVALALVAAPRAREGRPLASPGAMAALVVAAVITRLALAGQSADATPLETVCWRGAVRFLSVPDASFPLSIRLFVAVLAPAVAALTLLRKGGVASLSGAVALALTARGALEMPPCAAMIMVAALMTALTADDPRGLWAGLEPPSEAR